jgi:DNA repair protein RadC
VPYFKAGLVNNEYCVWITSNSPNTVEAQKIIRQKLPNDLHTQGNHQLEIVSFRDIFTRNGKLDISQYHRYFLDRLHQTHQSFYDGLRVASDLSWVEKEDWVKMVNDIGRCGGKNGPTHWLSFYAYPVEKCEMSGYINLLNAPKSSVIISNGKTLKVTGCKRSHAGEISNIRKKYRSYIQKLAKELFETREKYMDILLDNATMVAITIFDDGKYIEVNENYCRIFGYTRNEIIGHTSAELNIWLPDERATFAEKFRKQGRHLNEKATLRTRTGKMLQVLFSGELVDIGGKLCIVAVLYDITRLEKLVKKGQAIISTAIDGFWITDASGRFLVVNDSYCQMIGYTREELLKMDVNDVEASESPEEIAEYFKQSIHHGSGYFLTQHRREDGRIIDIEVNASLINPEKGQFFVCIRKLTGTKKIEYTKDNEQHFQWRKNTTALQQRFIEKGFGKFTDREIIELLLSIVLPSRKAHQLAKVCIDKFKNFATFLEASPEELRQTGVSPTAVFCIAMLHKLPIKVLQEKSREKSIYDSPQDIFDYFYYTMRDLKKEAFKAIYLNIRNQIINVVDLFGGTTDRIAINAREVIENAITHKTRRLIFVDNHPSGNPTPSEQDKCLTRDLVFIGNIIGIKVVDHIIIGNNRYHSFAEEGLIKEYELDFLNLKLTGTSEAKRRLSERNYLLTGKIHSD